MRVWPLVALLGACSTQTGPSISLKIAHGATGDGRCGVPGAADPAVTSLTSISRIRLSWRKHGKNDLKGSFLCDRVLKVGENPNLRLHVSGQESFDLFAEGFADAAESDPDNAAHGAFRRVATGGILGIPFNIKTIPTVRLYPVESFGCVAARMTRGRSFHSATALPNGQVLLVGGAIASSDGTSENLTSNLYFLTGDAEIYDPSDGTFHAVDEDSPPASRAFHQAFYLGTDGAGAFQVLLVGGLTSTDPTRPAIGVTNSGVGGPRLVPFDTSQTIPTALPAVGAKAELLTYDPVARHATRTAVDGFSEAAFLAGGRFGTLDAPDGFVVAGGVNYVDPLDTTQATGMSIRVQRGAETTPRTADLAPPGRLGASLAVLDADRALVWGGVLLGTAAQGEVLTGLNAGGAPMSTALGLPGIPGTQFQTATLVASGANSQVLVSGGFQVDGSGNASQPPPAASAVHLVTLAADGSLAASPVPFAGSYVPDSSTCTNGARYRPAGWESAVSLPIGRGVLISGGAPTFDQTKSCNDCEAGGASLLCSIRQASLYQNGAIQPAASLQVGRFGHATTLLGDGTLLVTGGTTMPPGSNSPRVSADAEIYNPRTSLPPYNTTDAAPADLDDPIAGDLVSGLQRAPGGLAFQSDPKQPVARCEDLN